jgi:hypothetical protein
VAVIDFVLLGAIAAAEAAGIPAVVLMHNVLSRPLPGIPPYGPGLLPAHGPFGFLRDALGRAIVNRIQIRNGGPPLNRARALLGLPARSSRGKGPSCSESFSPSRPWPSAAW